MIIAIFKRVWRIQIRSKKFGILAPQKGFLIFYRTYRQQADIGYHTTHTEEGS
jgi:hypothetical protein